VVDSLQPTFVRLLDFTILVSQIGLPQLANMGHDRHQIKNALWSEGDEGRLTQLSVPYAGNTRRPANAVGQRTLGVLLDMLLVSGLIKAGIDNLNCIKFVTDLVEIQVDVVAFVQSIPARAQVIVMGRSLRMLRRAT
jgi:hypothetical protein